MEFETEIEIMVPVKVNYSISGSYRAATRFEPEEHPELEITRVTFNQKELDELIDEIDQQSEFEGKAWKDAERIEKLDRSDYV